MNVLYAFAGFNVRTVHTTSPKASLRFLSTCAVSSAKFDRTEAQVPGQRDRVKPEFRRLIVAIHMYVRRFVGLMRMEVDGIWPHSQDRRHTLSISPFREMSKSQGKPDLILVCITLRRCAGW